MKSKQIAGIIQRDLWTLAERMDEGRPVILRLRRGLETLTDVRGYPMLLQITWPFQPRDEGGSPNRADAEAMDLFEERIVAAYESDAHAVLTAVVTVDGVRRWIFYTANAHVCGQRLVAMPQEPLPYPIDLTAEDDPDWTLLRQNILGVCKDQAA